MLPLPVRATSTPAWSRPPSASPAPRPGAYAGQCPATARQPDVHARQGVRRRREDAQPDARTRARGYPERRSGWPEPVEGARARGQRGRPLDHRPPAGHALAGGEREVGCEGAVVRVRAPDGQFRHGGRTDGERPRHRNRRGGEPVAATAAHASAGTRSSAPPRGRAARARRSPGSRAARSSAGSRSPGTPWWPPTATSSGFRYSARRTGGSRHQTPDTRQQAVSRRLAHSASPP